jgi:DMSO/TMAO reductase YedYZ molybdopterin-dependent catalytic subunit
MKNSKLNQRLVRSLLTGFIFCAFVFSSFFLVKYGPLTDGAPSILRSVLEANKGIWAAVYSPTRLSVKKPHPGKGKTPRANGLLGLESELKLENYKVEIENEDKTISLPLSAFTSMPKVGYSTDFKCIEGWVDVIQYAGTRFSDFMEAYHLGRHADGSLYRYVGLVTPDEEYYVSIDMDSMLHAQTILAYEMNDAPLSVENGAPIRLIIPIKYGVKSLKRIGKIFFSDERPPDYWEEEGYDWWAGL